MGRFLLGLLFAGVLFWSYETLFPGEGTLANGGPAAPELDEVVEGERVPDPGAVDGSGSAPSGERGEEQGDPGSPIEPEVLAIQGPSLEPFTRLTPAQFLAEIDSGNRAAAEAAYEVVRRLKPGPTRKRLATALATRIESAPTVEAALGLLGDDNDFLHSAEGRAAARELLARCLEAPDGEAVRHTTGVLERCMRGTIRKGDREARALVDEIYREHRKPVMRWTLNPTNLENARRYTVQSGDSLSRIAGRFRSKHRLALEAGTLAVLNRIHNPNALGVGEVVKVPLAPIRTVLEKGSYLMAVYVGDTILRLYWVGHGADGRTPETEFEVSAKVERPPWYAPDGEVYPYGHPKNILGEYFVKFAHPAHRGFGAHGTPDPETICTQSSLGCIRMYDEDIEDFFALVPRGSVVEVRDSR